MAEKYQTANALRVALEARLLDESRRVGRDLAWLRRRVALVRLALYDLDSWVLKGGMAIELRRPGAGRSTKDLDLVIRPSFLPDASDPVRLRQTLMDALANDPDDDGFIFLIAAPTRLQDDAYGHLPGEWWLKLISGTPVHDDEARRRGSS